MSPSARALRLVAATAALQSLAVVACAGCVHGLVRAAGTPTTTSTGLRTGVVLDPALAVVAAAETLAWAGLAACCAWFAAAVLATARDLARHPSRPSPRAVRGCLQPALLRSLLVVLVGGCVGSPVVAPASADDRGWEVLDGLPLPGLPLGGAARPPRAAPAGPHPTTVRVHAGDCLWSLTEDLLGPRATTAAVALAWPRLHRLNRSVVGPDPDLLRPGTTLRVPAGLAAHQHQHRPGAAR